MVSQAILGEIVGSDFFVILSPMKKERQEDEVSFEQIRGAILSREITQKNDGWQVIEEFPEKMLLGPNARERNDNFVRVLALNIISQGQIQECTGDIKDGQVRVWAGHHRFWAVELANATIDELNKINPEKPIERYRLRVRVKGKEFSEGEKLQVQIAENLHKSMRPEEEAATIFGIFSSYLEAVGPQRGSIAEFSRRIGFGEAKVGNAVRFMWLDPRVRMLVGNDALLYSVATRLSRVPNEKQLALAVKIVTHRLNDRQIDSCIKQSLGETEGQGLLFSLEQQKQIETENNRIRFRREVNISAREASGYFKRVLAVVKLVADKRLEMTEPVKDILVGFMGESDEFRELLNIGSPDLLRKLEEALEAQ